MTGVLRIRLVDFLGDLTHPLVANPVVIHPGERIFGQRIPKHQTQDDISDRAADKPGGLGTAASRSVSNDALDSTAAGGLERRKGGISRAPGALRITEEPAEEDGVLEGHGCPLP